MDSICDSLNSVGLGLMTGYTMGGVIQALLVIAIVVVLIRIIHGRSPV